MKFENGTTLHPDAIIFDNSTTVQANTIRFNSTHVYNVTCEPIPCPKLRGWSGEFMPNCTFKPYCPDNFPGHFPYCNKYAYNVTSTTLPIVLAPTKKPNLNSRFSSEVNTNSIDVTEETSDQQSNGINFRSSV